LKKGRSNLRAKIRAKQPVGAVMSEPREYWIAYKDGQEPSVFYKKMTTYWLANDYHTVDHLIGKSAYDDLDTRLKTTVSAAYHALLEMSAFMGIPEHKRKKQIDYLMENVKYCADNAHSQPTKCECKVAGCALVKCEKCLADESQHQVTSGG